MAHGLQLADLLNLLDSGITVLVPTHAAALDLRRHFDARRSACDLQEPTFPGAAPSLAPSETAGPPPTLPGANAWNAWEPPTVFSWQQWLESLWDTLVLEGAETRVLLNALQEEHLWTSLAPAAGLNTLPSTTLHALAGQAAAGLARAADYLLTHHLAPTADSPDTRAFASWHRAFGIHCHKHGLLTRSMLCGELTAHLAANRLSAPDKLHLVGFQELTPALESLLATLRQGGSSVTVSDLSSPSPAANVRSTIVEGDPQQELRWAVRYVRLHLDNHPARQHPVALLCSDPEAERQHLEPLLRELLAPELEAVTQDLSSTPWQFSTAPALASHTLIAHALQLLQWTQTELPIEQIGNLLLSPYLAHTDPYEARARFEMHTLRRSSLLRPELTLNAFLKFVSAAKQPRAEADLLAFPELRALHTETGHLASGKATHGEWAERVRRLLHVAGWPGPRTPSALEFQLHEAWDGTLDLLTTLDLESPRLSFSDFLGLLASQARRVSPAPCNNTPVLHVLRPEDAEGRLFDLALVLRATENELPRLEAAHPLISWSLQKAHGVPGTSAELAHTRSLRALRSLADRTPALLLITASHDANGPLRLTELAHELGCQPLPAAEQHNSSGFETAHPLGPELIADTAPLPPLPSNRIAGGARVLELQASCGFRAFASLRLGASLPETGNLGGGFRDAGQDLHKALEIFWQQTASQAALRAFTPTQRHQAVTSAVHAALAYRHHQASADPWTEAYLEVAEHRLTHLLLQWLERELLREPFTVMQQEEKQSIAVGPLELSIRPDRVDEVEGGIAFVDYKTSQDLSARHWLGDRPEAPQLPLYALLADPSEVRALAFGRVRPGTDMGWISLQAESGLFPRKGATLADDLGTQIALWKTELTRLAEEFAAGTVCVDPKSYPKSCQYCQQRLLCRLDPATLLAVAPGTASDDDSGEVDSAR